MTYSKELKERRKQLSQAIVKQERIVYQGKLTPDWMEQYQKLNDLRQSLSFVQSRLKNLRRPNNVVMPHPLNINQLIPQK